MIKLRITSIIDADTRKEKTCIDCGHNRFYLTQGTKRRNTKKIVGGKTYEQTQYYIQKCTNCNDRKDQTIYDWRQVISRFA